MYEIGLGIEIYSSGTVKIADPLNELFHISEIKFNTIYPGGLYSSASFFVARDVTRSWELSIGRRVVIRESADVVFEGYIIGFDYLISPDREGITVNCIGAWGYILMSRRLDKPWCDTRIDDGTWIYPSDAYDANSQQEKGSVNREDRLKLIPKAEAFTINQNIRCEYLAPINQTVKKVTGTYDFNEGAQNWKLGIFSVTGAVDEYAITATGTAAFDETFVSPSRQVFFYLMSGASQTPASDGSIYAELTGLKVYTELSAINGTEIITDIIGYLTDFNSSTVLVGSNTLTIEPFITDGWQTCAEILNKIMGYGDSSHNRWAAYAGSSELAETVDGKPVLIYEAYPVLTGYDYLIDLDFSALNYAEEITDLANWIIVEYEGEDGRRHYLTPDDEATLTDAQSVTDYGQRDYLLKANNESAGNALSLGERFLTSHKDPTWRVTSPINVVGHITARSGEMIPASRIRAGKRLRVQNVGRDYPGASGLTLLISQTAYTDETKTCGITAGVVPLLEIND